MTLLVLPLFFFTVHCGGVSLYVLRRLLPSSLCISVMCDVVGSHLPYLRALGLKPNYNQQY